jgi:hypothetical protein
MNAPQLKFAAFSSGAVVLPVVQQAHVLLLELAFSDCWRTDPLLYTDE